MAWGRWEKGVVDAVCVASILGIWPRFIEPRLLRVRRHRLPLVRWRGPPLRVLHLSDLHWDRDAPHRAVRKMLAHCGSLNPDLVFWSGDFLVDSNTHDWSGLADVLRLCRGRFGTFACLGNHDYSTYTPQDGRGEQSVSRLMRILTRIVSPVTPALSQAAPLTPPQPRLLEVLAACKIDLLDNASTTLALEGGELQIAGVGDFTTGQMQRVDPHPSHANVLLCHNPDGVPLVGCGWSAILSGHTHGRQVNLPWLGQRLCRAATSYTRGLYRQADRSWLHVSSGLGCCLPFRLFSLPEATLMEWLPEAEHSIRG